jgi:hypothetical protein
VNPSEPTPGAHHISPTYDVEELKKLMPAPELDFVGSRKRSTQESRRRLPGDRRTGLRP